jgi:nicotinate dehydrogenase subunit B
MRLLPERMDYDEQGFARQNSESHRRRDTERLGRFSLPLWLPCASFPRGPPCSSKARERLKHMARQIEVSRRQFVKEAGGLLIGFCLTDAESRPRIFGVAPSGAIRPTPAARLDSWLRIEPDGRIRMFTGKTEIGMGVETALIQIVAEELDVSPGRVSFVMGDTATTVDQGGVGGSTSVMLGAKPLRNAAATARFLLLQLASRRLAVPSEQLEVSNGVVRVKGDATQSVSYGALVAASGLEENLAVSGAGFALNAQGAGKPKDPGSYNIVGKPIPRVDIPPKVFGQFQYVTDIRLPEMLHGRVVRPPGVGANLLSVDEKLAKAIPGFVKTIVERNFVGVVAESEWAAVRAVAVLRISWTKPALAFPEQSELYLHMRNAPPKVTKTSANRGDAAAALRLADKRVEASYEWPFQSHATMGPGCAVADVRAGGVTTIWSGAQKPHALQKGIADLLRVSVDKVQVLWTEDAGSYGRPGFEDAAADAALLSRAIGKPVRVQWMRSDMSGWGTKGPAVACDLAAGLDANGTVTAFTFISRAFSGGEIFYHPDTADNFLGAQLSGVPNTTGKDEFAEYGEHSAAYDFPNVQAFSHVVPSLFTGPSPLRTTHLRDPEGPAVTFSVESFLDEVAAAAGFDPIEFRLTYLEDPRAKAVLAAVAERSGWDRRPSPKKAPAAADIVTGRGVALGIRRGTYVATVAEVEVNLRTGAVHVRRFVCAHDCGLIVNPDALRGTIEANLIQSMSRSLNEEVTFSRSSVTSVDWRSYPIAATSDIPKIVEVVLLNHPELPPSGAGEPASRPTAAAIANAIFDATGARVRQAPLTAARVQTALAGARPA